MPERPAVAELFREHRPMLLATAYRILGNVWDAEDALQDAWLRLDGANLDEIRDARAWLATLVARSAIDAVRRRIARGEVPDDRPDSIVDDAADVEELVLREEQIGVAFGVILRELSPLDRVSLLLHDVFGVGFDEIGAIISATAASARQRASRARRRLRGIDLAEAEAAQKQSVGVFLAAAREGDLATLLKVLAPDVTLHADAGTIALARPYADSSGPLLAPVVHGAEAVSTAFSQRIAHAEMITVMGMPAIGYRLRGRHVALYLFEMLDGQIIRIEALADDDALAAIDA